MQSTLGHLDPRQRPNWLRVTAAVAGTVVLFVLLLWPLPEWQANRYGLHGLDRAKEVDEYRRTLTQIVGGALLLAGGFFTYRQLGIAQENLKATQSTIEMNRKASEETLQVNREGQITDRFTRAVAQLGESDTNGRKKMELRLGGIYALERIARDSPRDHGPIMEVLTAYVRHNSPGFPQDIGAAAIGPGTKLDADIQAVITVLARRPPKTDGREEQPIDLSATDLRGARFHGGHFEGANLEVAHLEGAQLIGTHLEDAWLPEAHLENAHLLGEIRLDRANLLRAHLEDAQLPQSHLESSALTDAHLNRASLWSAHLENAVLAGAHLEGSDLKGAHFDGAILEGTHLEDAELIGARGLTREQLWVAHRSRGTKLPPAFSDLETDTT